MQKNYTNDSPLLSHWKINSTIFWLIIYCINICAVGHLIGESSLSYIRNCLYAIDEQFDCSFYQLDIKHWKFLSSFYKLDKMTFNTIISVSISGKWEFILNSLLIIILEFESTFTFLLTNVLKLKYFSFVLISQIEHSQMWM